MKPLVVLYATRTGYTRRIAEYLAMKLRERRLAVDVIDAAAIPAMFKLEDYVTAVLASSVYLGRHQREIERFAMEHHAALQRLEGPTAFLSVSLEQMGAEESHNSPEKRDAAARAARETIHTFIAKTGWHPSQTRAVAGALNYSKYGALTRFLMRLAATRVGAPTDPSRDYERTDWSDLDRLADLIADALNDSRSRWSAPSPP